MSEEIGLLKEIKKTCSKIRDGVSKNKIELNKLFKNLDFKCTGFISEQNFLNLLHHHLSKELALSKDEVCALASHLKSSDGCIKYSKLLDLLKPLEFSKKDFVTGLEWEDPMHVNRMAESEERHLAVLLTKIAQMVRLKDIALQPYFNDYEKVTHNNGVMTISHFHRVLYILGITVSEKEFQIIVKKFLKDSYTLNYVAFLTAIENILEQIESQTSIDLVKNYPGKIITVDFPQLPRPEIGTVNTSKVLGHLGEPHPCFKDKCEDRDCFELIMMRIKKHILDNSIKTSDYFQDFDKLNCGLITIAQFVRAMESIGISGLHRLFISQANINLIIENYKDFDRVCWKKFCNDIDEVFQTKNLDELPYSIVQSPSEEFQVLLRQGQEDWTCQPMDIRELAEATILKVKNYIKRRSLPIHQFFRGYDRSHNFHVSKSQFNRVLATIGILLSEKETCALQKRYCDDMGFNYWRLLEDVEEFEGCGSSNNKETFVKTNNSERILPCKEPRTIVEIIAAIRGQIIRNRTDMKGFLTGSDKLNHKRITKNEFIKGLSNAKIALDHCELDLLCNCFESQIEEGYVDYKCFCDVINEALLQPQIEKNPLLVPLQLIPITDSSKNFLNFEERTITSKALQKLAKQSDIVSNLSSLFEDFDRHKSQSVSQNQLVRALTTRNMMKFLSSRELDAICKCFAVEKGGRQDFHYRNFLQTLSLLNATKEYYLC